LERVNGTIVKEVQNVEKMLVRGVTRDNDIARISLVNIEDTPGKAFKIFSLLAKKNVNVDVILQSIGRENTKDITFTVSKDHLQTAIEILNENLATLGAKAVDYDKDVSKVSIVGAGMVSNPGVAALMFEALYDAQINIHMISTSEIKVSVIIDEKNAEDAVRAIHDKFNLHE
jgi:aspartate kinase